MRLTRCASLAISYVGAAALRGPMHNPTISNHQVHVSLGRQEGARRGSTVAAAPGITTKGTSLFIAISTYISHTSAQPGRKREAATRKAERERERMRE